MPSAACLTCGLAIDESRALETNYLHGEFGKPGGPQDWFACAGCLTAFRITWEPIPGIGDDSWGMFPTPEVLVPGSSVARTIERLRTATAAGDARRALEDLRAAPESPRLMQIPEVVEAAWAAFGGRAVTATNLAFAITKLPKNYSQYNSPLLMEYRVSEPVVELRVPEATELPLLLAAPDEAGFRRPDWRSTTNMSALVMQGTPLSVIGSDGPFVQVKPVLPLWKDHGDFDHFRVRLERLTIDPLSP